MEDATQDLCSDSVQRRNFKEHKLVDYRDDLDKGKLQIGIRTGQGHGQLTLSTAYT